VAIKIPSYLHRNKHGFFGFRVVVPSDLRVFRRHKEFRVSLRTRNKNSAKRHALPLTIMINNVFDRIRSASSVEEACKVGDEFVRLINDTSGFDETTCVLKELLPGTKGKARDMLAHLIALRERHQSLPRKKRNWLKSTFNNSRLPKKPKFKWASSHDCSTFCPVGMWIKNPKRANVK